MVYSRHICNLIMSLAELGLTEDQVLQTVYTLLRERDPTFVDKMPLTIPTTKYVLSGESFEAFFKLSSGSIANVVIFLEAVHRGKLAKETLIELIENQIALPNKLTAQLKNGKQVHSIDRRQHLVEATKLLEKLKSLPR
jgi:hypothetical protein